MNENILEKYKRWADLVTDEVIKAELESIKDDEDKILDAFYRELEFGTGGLRGVLGAGSNRMNIYTVAKATQGLANYITKNFDKEKRSVAISYDSRINSSLFAKVSAEVMAANGINVHIYKELMPTPCLSFAVRELNCVSGIMVTASHNPAKYNGYKVYGADGCQITTNAADEILSEIENVDPFQNVKKVEFDEALSSGLIKYIDDEVYTKFTECVKGQSVLKGVELDKSCKIVYSPLNGTGLKPVLRALDEAGFKNITVVKEQEQPDGNFPTCPYPNPEIREAMALGIKYATENNADLLLATDPDCDRVGIAVKDNDGNFKLLSGNETGLLLLDFICKMRIKNGTMPKRPVCVKTIVTSDLASNIAKKYNVLVKNVLTGFKFIGEQIAALEATNDESDYIFGFEESYGYLSGTYVRDKDAVNASFLICEMFAYYKAQGISLLEQLNALYKEFGYALNTLHSYTFEGASGFTKMQNIMTQLRKGLSNVGGRKVVELLDYNTSIDGLPKSNVLKFVLEDQASLIVRPSGTEPKLKAYISVTSDDEVSARFAEEKIAKEFAELLK